MKRTSAPLAAPERTPDAARAPHRPAPGRRALALVVLAATFLGLDATWLGTMSARLYRPAVGQLLAAQPDLVAATAFYALYLIGVAVFALRPAVPLAARGRVAARAALFGLVAYGTYDLTNQATLREWPWTLTAIDLCWGVLATTLATLAADAVLRRRGT